MLFLLRAVRSTISLLLITLVFLLGMASYELKILIPKDDVSHFIDKRITLMGIIDEEPSFNDDSVRFDLKAERVETNDSTKIVSGKVSITSPLLNARLKYGDRIKIQGLLSEFNDTKNPDLFSYSDYLRSQGIRCKLSSYNCEPEILSRGHGNPAVSFAIYLCSKFNKIIESTLKKPYSSLLGSIVLGSKASPPSGELKEAYKKVGVVHLLVASGMPLTILMGVILAICRAVKMRSVPSVISASVINIIYTLVTGAGPSIVRAFFMSEMTLVAMLIDREKDVYISLAFAALCLFILNPLNLFDIGFQLSFAATWSLFYISPVLEEKFKALMPRTFSSLLSCSLSPVLATTPITVYNFSQFSVVAILANILILPWAGILLNLGFISLGVGLVFLPLASILNGTICLMLKLLNFIVFTLAALPFASISVVKPSVALIIGYYAGMIGMIELLKGNKLTKKRSAAAILFIITVLIWNGAFAGPSFNGDLVLTMIDVGQGDSILVEAGGHTMLVDGGGSEFSKDTDYAGANIVVPFLRRKGINKLDLVVLTHPHADHAGGLSEVLKRIKVDLILDPQFPDNSPAYKKFIQLIKVNKIPWKLARAGEVINFGKGIRGYVLAPADPLLKGTISDPNNNSVVIRLVYGKISFLLAGDTEKEAEKRLMGSSALLKSDVLKVGHHGSGGASSDEFLARASPEIALISCGIKNKFHHPNKSALKRLAEHKSKVLRTDLNGAIIIKTDGE
ncbi:MAG: DNA internalization-related competence protein ComEC/Rec2 [Candidatus Saganbacteria bacterium]|nr:DNA internalization-related competence protein ComEC/Rec2 [Candidatus Saganbacteria bacterium]